MPLVEYTGEVIPAKQSKDFEKGPEGFQLSTQEQLREKVGNDWWHLPAAFGAGAVAFKAASSVYDWLKSKEKSAARIDPTLDLKTPPGQPEFFSKPSTVMTAGGPVNLNEVPPEMRPMVERSAQVTQQKMAGTPVAPPAVAPVPVAPAAPGLMAGAPTGAPVAPAPLQIPSLTQTVEQGGNITKAVQADVAKQIETGPQATAKTGSGQPAFLGEGPERSRMPKGGVFGSPADIPKGMAFVPGAQYYDSLANAARSRTAAQDIVRAKGSYPISDAQAREWAGEFLKSSGAETRDAMLAAGKKPDVVSGIFEKIGSNKSKLVKMGAAGGALVAVSNLANAKTPGQALEATADILGAVLPPQVQAAIVGLTGAPVAPSTLPAGYAENAALLGSPYYGTEWAKSQRMREGAGAGRGFVNPPMAR